MKFFLPPVLLLIANTAIAEAYKCYNDRGDIFYSQTIQQSCIQLQHNNSTHKSITTKKELNSFISSLHVENIQVSKKLEKATTELKTVCNREKEKLKETEEKYSKLLTDSTPQYDHERSLPPRAQMFLWNERKERLKEQIEHRKTTVRECESLMVKSELSLKDRR